MLDSRYGVLVVEHLSLDVVDLLLQLLVVLMLLLLFQFLLVITTHFVLVVRIVAMLMVMDITNREEIHLMFREVT